MDIVAGSSESHPSVWLLPVETCTGLQRRTAEQAKLKPRKKKGFESISCRHDFSVISNVGQFECCWDLPFCCRGSFLKSPSKNLYLVGELRFVFRNTVEPIPGVGVEERASVRKWSEVTWFFFFVTLRRLSDWVRQAVQPEGVDGWDTGKEFSRGGKQRSVRGATKLKIAVDSSADVTLWKPCGLVCAFRTEAA